MQNINRYTFLHTEPTSDAETGTPFGKGYRRKRISFTVEQLDRLEESFQMNKYPGITTREQLSDELGVSESRVQVLSTELSIN